MPEIMNKVNLQKFKHKRPRMSIEEIANALKEAGGFQSRAAQILGCTRHAVNMRISRSEVLQQILEDIKSKYVDIAEIELLKKVQGGDTTAIIFTLKCLGKDRGYIDRQEIHAQLLLSHDDWIKKLDEPE